MSENTVTRAQLAEAIFREIGISVSESSEVVDALFEEMSIALQAQETIKISSFGNFKVKKKSARIGRNPKTKVETIIKPRNVVSFHASQTLKKRMNDRVDA